MSSARFCRSRRGISSLTVNFKNHALVDIHPEVQDALQSKKPVVALESTIITHGMPYPVNLNAARSVERIVRSTGSVPATIGLINGRVKIGLLPSELERLAECLHAPVKLSRRDIGPAMALRRDGGTTCSATLIFAAAAGIKVFATGGLGGVHRGGQDSMDVSADLQELTRCPVGLVSAGVKSILDIGRTLEYLETLGVPVVTYGETDHFPAFYSSRSQFKSPWRVDSPDIAAEILHNQHQLGMSNGVLFGVPIPSQYHTVGDTIQNAVELAVKESEKNGMSRRGKEVTPWLLKRVNELTNGQSLPSNVALIENTALVGGQIAASYARLSTEKTSNIKQKSYPSTETFKNIPSPPADLVIVGSAALDITSVAQPLSDVNSSHILHSTTPGRVSISLGGVGRNIAEGAHRLLTKKAKQKPTSPVLVSLIGQDMFGSILQERLKGLGMRTDGLISTDLHSSAVCNMILDREGGLVTGIADMDIIQSLDGQSVVDHIGKYRPKLVAFDGNLSTETLSTSVKYCSENNISIFFEPTSVTKSSRILPSIPALLTTSPARSPITFASPNILELQELWREIQDGPLSLTSHNKWWQVIDAFSIGSGFRMELDHLARRNASDEDPFKGSLSFLVDQGIAQMAINLLPFFQHLVVKCGQLGVVVIMRVPNSSKWSEEGSNIHKRCIVSPGRWDGDTAVLIHFPPHHVPDGSIVNVTGAGDTLVGAVLAALTQSPLAFDDPETLTALIADAQLAATLTLQSAHAVSPELSN